MGSLRTVWRALGSIKLAAILLVVLLVFSVVASLFPQIPGEPAARDSWLAAVSLRYHRTAGLLRSLGLFQAYRAPWFLVSLGALSLNLLICTLQPLARLWRSLTRPLVPVRTEAFYQGFARRADWPVASLEQGLSAVLKILRARGYRYRQAATAADAVAADAVAADAVAADTVAADAVAADAVAADAVAADAVAAGAAAADAVAAEARVEPEEEGVSPDVAYVAAERYRWAAAGTAVSHLAVLALIAAVVAGPALRWQETGITLVPEQVHTLGHGPSLAMHTDSLVEQPETGGQPGDYYVPLTVTEAEPEGGDARSVTRTVGTGRPFTYRGVSFHLQAVGPAVRVLSPEGTVLLPTPNGESQEITLPAAGLVLRVAYEPAGEQPGAVTATPLFVSVSTLDGTALRSGEVADGQEIVIQGIPLTFSLSHYTVWQVSHDPTFALAVGMAGLLLAAAVVSLWVPHRRLWLRIEDGRALMVGTGASARTFYALATRLARACHSEKGLPGLRAGLRMRRRSRGDHRGWNR